jgi:predicted ATPase
MALIKKLIPMLRVYSEDSQFVISSHSAAVMSLTEPEEIRFITNENGSTQARGLTADELESAREFLDEEGPLGEFLQSMGA